LRLFEAIYRPIPKEKEKEFKKICREQKAQSQRMRDLAAERLTEIFIKHKEAKKEKLSRARDKKK